MCLVTRLCSSSLCTGAMRPMAIATEIDFADVCVLRGCACALLSSGTASDQRRSLRAAYWQTCALFGEHAPRVTCICTNASVQVVRCALCAALAPRAT